MINGTSVTNHLIGDQTHLQSGACEQQGCPSRERQGYAGVRHWFCEHEAVVLPDVWYAPGLSINLVSVEQLTEDPELIIEIGGLVVRVASTRSMVDL